MISSPAVIYEDNQSKIEFVDNPVYHKRSKHVDVKYQFARENRTLHCRYFYETACICVVYCVTCYLSIVCMMIVIWLCARFESVLMCSIQNLFCVTGRCSTSMEYSSQFFLLCLLAWVALV